MTSPNAGKRFVLVNLVDPFTSHDEAEKDLEELTSLVKTFGGADIVHIIQKKMRPDPGTYIGKGKAEELVAIVRSQKANTVVINDMVRTGQLYNLQQMMWEVNPHIQVWDRIDLILNIFSRHAHTAEAKLQIDLARMRHMGPRMYGLGTALSRQGGGIGTRGLGETNIELMKRHWRNEMKNTQEKLDKLVVTRQRQLDRRREIGMKTVSIIGYTNAGKTTLFNTLTGKRKLSADVLFATLDSLVGTMYIQDRKTNIVISDTIGFIQKLPASLIEAFKSTLMESVNADVLLHVIDASDHLMHEKIHVVDTILSEMGLGEKKQIYVFNKIDAANHLKREEVSEVYEAYTPHFVSVKTGEGVSELKQMLEASLFPQSSYPWSPDQAQAA